MMGNNFQKTHSPVPSLIYFIDSIQNRLAPRSENLKDAVLRDIKSSVQSLQKGREVLQKALDANEVGGYEHPGGYLMRNQNNIN